MRMKHMLLLVLVFAIGVTSQAQLLKKMSDAAKAKVDQKMVQKTEKAVDKMMDAKLPKKDTTSPSMAKVPGNGANDASTISNFALYSKFDFVAGEKVLLYEDFTGDAIGDFPAHWNTNASGEVVKVKGASGQWLKLENTGVYMPENLSKLPENFTLEFEVMCNPEFRYSASPLFFAVASLKTPKDYVVWQEGWGGRKGFLTWILPTSPTAKSGKAGYRYYTDAGENWGEQETNRFHVPAKNKVKVSIWRQKQRVRVYLDEEKIVDVAKAFNAGDYNAFVFSLNTQKTAPDQYMISNIRLAVGAPDTRNKLLTEGKFVTTGILFDVNSDRIQPASYGVLKEIATAMQSEPLVRFNVIGHTDSDGDIAANQELSERRAAAVKKVLETEFSIEPGRLQSLGKGESIPVGDNKTQAGKAQNRRVEFVKL